GISCCSTSRPRAWTARRRRGSSRRYGGWRRGRLDPPVAGAFTGDRGDFHGEDTYNGRQIRVHFTWYRLGRDTARWEQEFSADDGRSWELNWIMDLTRTGRVGG
ncbi:hypothetical protein ACWD60_41820, partial [Streptomyces sp. NPDC005167]